MLRIRHLLLALFVVLALLPGLGSDLLAPPSRPQRLAPAAGVAAPARTPVYLPFVLRPHAGPTPTPTRTLTPGASPTPTHTPAPTMTPTVTPTPGEGRIAFDSNRDGDWEIYAMDPAGANLAALTQNQGGYESQAAWSPDGSRIAFVSMRDGNPEIYVMNADGSNPTNLTQNAAQDWNPAW